MTNRRAAENNQSSVLKGLAAGTVAGLVASWTMEEFQVLWVKAARAKKDSHGNGADGSSSTNKADRPHSRREAQEPSTVKAAEMISEKVLGRKLAKDQKKFAGNAVHYTTGGASGAVYGVAAELAPEVTVGAGLPFGTAVWLAIDEGAVPLLGLSKGPTEYPLSTHVYALASHFVYGLTTEVVRRVLRKTVLQ